MGSMGNLEMFPDLGAPKLADFQLLSEAQVVVSEEDNSSADNDKSQFV